MKKLEMNLDDLQVESFETEPQALTEKVVGYYGGHKHSETTCMQIICDCSMGHTDCDATCPGYQWAADMSCEPHNCG